MVKYTEAQTMTDFMASYGYNTTETKDADPSSELALFTPMDSLMAWRLLRLLRRNMGTIRSCVRQGTDGQIDVPLMGWEVPLVSTALRVLSDQVSSRSDCYKRIIAEHGKGSRLYLLSLALKETTIDPFMGVWKETGPRYRDSAHIFESLPGKSQAEQLEIMSRIKPDEGSEYNQSDWPTQWTVEFPLALQEYLRALERFCEMLAAVCGTHETDVRTDGDMGEVLPTLLMARYGLDAKCVDELMKRRRLHIKWAGAPPRRLTAEEVYCAAYLATALDNFKSDRENGVPYARPDATMRLFFGAGKLLYLSLYVLTEARFSESNLALILNAFIKGVFLPELSNDTDGGDVHHLIYYEKSFRMDLDRLHSLVRDMAGDLELDLPH